MEYEKHIKKEEEVDEAFPDILIEAVNQGQRLDNGQLKSHVEVKLEQKFPGFEIKDILSNFEEKPPLVDNHNQSTEARPAESHEVGHSAAAVAAAIRRQPTCSCDGMNCFDMNCKCFKDGFYCGQGRCLCKEGCLNYAENKLNVYYRRRYLQDST